MGPSKGEQNGFVVSAGIGSYQTNLSYLPATSTFNSSLQLHHPGFMVHLSSELVDSVWGLRTENLWTVSHTVSPSASALVTFPKEAYQDFPESPDPTGRQKCSTAQICNIN